VPEPITPVTGDFVWSETKVGRVLTSRTLSTLAPHVFTTRDRAFRGGPVDPDYLSLAAVFGVDEPQVVRVRQVHGKVVLKVDRHTAIEGHPDADALISTDPRRVMAVRVADCVPILIADRQGRAVAAVHAGWRGTAAGIAAETVERLGRDGIAATELVAAVGPSVGPCCYQVDVIVKDAFQAVHGDRSGWFAADGRDRWRLDLWTATVDQLAAAGVPPGAIHVARLCTSHHMDVFHSYRGDRSDGRMVAAIRLRGD
jgi:YfiH family protein